MYEKAGFHHIKVGGQRALQGIGISHEMGGVRMGKDQKRPCSTAGINCMM